MDVFVGAGFLLIIRPLAGWVSLWRAGLNKRARLAISFFGVRGVGSIYYLAWAMNKASFDQSDRIWSIVSFVLLGSILLHGVSASPVMSYLDRFAPSRTTSEVSDEGDAPVNAAAT